MLLLHKLRLTELLVVLSALHIGAEVCLLVELDIVELGHGGCRHRVDLRHLAERNVGHIRHRLHTLHRLRWGYLKVKLWLRLNIFVLCLGLGLNSSAELLRILLLNNVVQFYNLLGLLGN